MVSAWMRTTGTAYDATWSGARRHQRLRASLGVDNLRSSKYFRFGVNQRQRKKDGVRLPRVKSAVLFASALAFALLAMAGEATSGVLGASQRTTLSAPTPGSPQSTLQQALALFAPEHAKAYSRAVASAVDPRSATLVLRDLAAQFPRLSEADRRLARAILARPTDGASEGAAGWDGIPKRYRKRACNRRFCVHWVTRGDERPSLADRRPRNGRPDWVDKTIANMHIVWNREIRALGYRKPLSDRSSGSHHGGNPNRRIDIYIAQIGNRSLYGYCGTDEPRPSRTSNRRVSAYCVVDNNFRRAEFPSGAAGVSALKVTLAHEFFHAIQFAYDYFDNRAMLEGTATWIEDQVFTRVNDNRYFLTVSPLGRDPYAPLDLFTTSGRFAGWHYGTWIWYRFLSENLGSGRADLPLVVRRIWEQAMGPARNGFDAIDRALTNRGTTVLAQVKRFGEWNAAPRAAGHYREARQGRGYPTPTPMATPGDTPLLPNASYPFAVEMDRRANDYLKLHPDSTVPPGATLDFSSVTVPTPRGDLVGIVFNRNGTRNRFEIADGTRVPFADATVDKVVIVFTNAAGVAFVAPNFFQFNVTVTP
jgi:hypothetical protein